MNKILLTTNKDIEFNIDFKTFESKQYLKESLLIHLNLKRTNIVLDDYELAVQYGCLFFNGSEIENVGDAEHLLGLPEFVQEKHTQSILKAAHVDETETLKLNSLEDADIDELSSKADIIVFKAPTGCGKTQLITNPVSKKALDSGEGVFAISPLVSIVDTIKNSVEGIATYNNLSPDDLSGNSVVSTINSAHHAHVKALSEKSSVVVIEEFASCFETIAENKLLASKRMLAYENLLNTLKNCKKAYLLDADINDIHIEFLKKTGREILVVEVPNDYSDIEAEFTNKGQLLESIKEAVEAGQKVSIAVDTRAHVDEIASMLEGTKGLLTIKADNKELPDQKSFIDNPNDLEGINVLIYNSVISRSLSIVTKHFERNFGLFTGVLTPSSCVQMLRRDRTAKKFEISVDARFCVPNEPEDFISNELEKIASQNTYLKSSISTSLKITMESMKFKTSKSVYDIEKKAKGYKTAAKSKKDVKNEYTHAVLTSNTDLTVDQAKKKLKSSKLTNEDVADCHAVVIKDQLGEVSESAIKFYAHGHCQRTLQLHSILQMSATDRFELDQKEEGRLMKDRTHAQLLFRAYNIIFKNLWNGEHFEINQENAVAIIKEFGNKRLINNLGIVRLDKGSDGQKRAKEAVKEFIKALGYSFSALRSTGGSKITERSISDVARLVGFNTGTETLIEKYNRELAA